jgi:hypothetical protein
MSNPTPSIRFSSSTPPSPPDALNVAWQSDGDTVLQSISASLPVMVGDTGAGGTMGLVPAPAAGDAAAGKVLGAGGSFVLLSVGGLGAVSSLTTTGSGAATLVDGLLNVPTPAPQVNSDWTAASGMGMILHQPTLAASATTDTTNAANITSGTLSAARLPSGIAAASWVDEETPLGTLDGLNTNFTLVNVPVPARSLHLYMNGLRLSSAGDYSLSGAGITFVAAPHASSVLLADYRF